jgi:hypothetical protein
MQAQEAAKSLEASRQKAKADAEVHQTRTYKNNVIQFSTRLADTSTQFTRQAKYEKTPSKHAS